MRPLSGVQPGDVCFPVAGHSLVVARTFQDGRRVQYRRESLCCAILLLHIAKHGTLEHNDVNSRSPGKNCTFYSSGSALAS